MSEEYLTLQWDGQLIALSYFSAVLGALLSLDMLEEARNAQKSSQKGFMYFLVSSAIGLGVCGIWTMHFIGMLALKIDGVEFQYDLFLCILSAIVAIIFVFAGFYCAMGSGFKAKDPIQAIKNAIYLMKLKREGADGNDDSRSAFERLNSEDKKDIIYRGNTYCDPIRKSDLLPIVLGGVIAGSGVAAMHYIGMASMKVNADVTWNTGIIVLSVIIAVIVATVGLLLLSYVRGPLTQLVTAIIVGIAVCSMHYTGMYAMQVTNVCVIGEDGCNPFDSGSKTITPEVLFITFTISVLSYFMTLTARIRILQQRYGMALLIGFIRIQLDRVKSDITPQEEKNHVMNILLSAFDGIKPGDLSSFLEKEFETKIRKLSKQSYNPSLAMKSPLLMKSDMEVKTIR